MSWTSEGAFEEFFQATNLPGDHRGTASVRKDWVVGRLRGGRLNIIDSFTMGSIPRFTALRDHADLDVVVVLHYGQHIKDRLPSSVLSTVKTALGSGAGSVRRHGQAVTMKFQSWPNVDVVPASRIADSDGKVTDYTVPDMNRGIWLPTNPPEHSRQMAAAASERGSNFRRVVKMVEDWNRRQDVSLQSYHLEVIALKTNASWNDHSWPLFQWFQTAQSLVQWCWYDDQDVSGYLPYDRAQRVLVQLREAGSAAQSAWHADYNRNQRQAIALWRSVFGQKFPSYG